jgi:fatty acid desaturase
MAASPIEDQEISSLSSEPSFQFCTPSEAPHLSSKYKELRNSIDKAGLFARQYCFYAKRILLTWCLLVLALVLLPMTRDHCLYVVDAVCLAFVFGQLGFLGHDGAHGEIFRKWRHNHLFCLIQGNFLMGLSTGWWAQKHNLHHSNPNCITLDGELEIAAVAFTEEQALSRQGFMRVLAKYQAWTFFPLLTLTALALRVESVQFIARSRPRYYFAEAFLLASHFALYGWFVFSALGFLRGTIFVLVHQILFGLYMGSVFAPNHKGMPMLKSGGRLDFLNKQVITARNITPGVIADFCYGGLNYQIEHHLFPSMPRNRLREARKIVEPFCRAHGIPYAETGTLQSYHRILQYLNNVSLAVRGAETRPGKLSERKKSRMRQML